ncbi:MAG: MerR family transcriptional regulator [Polyangiaceae bacterium]|nr:MerR family transcriptional regulator [Polyangiaceae bacterium]
MTSSPSKFAHADEHAGYPEASEASPTASEVIMTADDETPRHRIGAVARLTGISTHALRVWERRYGTLKPERSGGGDRLYTDGDVQRLRLIKRLLGLGHGIGDVARLPAPELEKLVALHHEPEEEPPFEPGLQLVQRYVGHIERLDLAAAEQTLAGAALALPRRELIDRVLVPILHEIGSRWQGGELHVAHEHAASAMVRSQLGAMLRLFAPDASSPTAVASTPAGEHHELGALMAAVVAAMSGWRCVYLGPNLPASEVARAVKSSAADAVLLSAVCLPAEATAPYVAELDSALPAHTTLVLGGHSAQSITALPRGVVRVADLAELESWLSARVSLGGKHQPRRGAR